MFPWSGVFSVAPQVPGQRSPEELVTDTLMLELGVLLKRAERLQQERGAEVRRRRSSVDYSWLADPPQRPAYEPSTGELLELCHLCAKIRPQQCGPVILRLRKLVAEFEPDAHEVPRIFRSVLLDCLDEEEGRAGAGQRALRTHAGRWDKQRSKSLSYITFRSQFLVNPFRGGRGGELPEEGAWSGDEEEPAPTGVSARARRVHSLPDITPTEERWHKGKQDG
uniref:RD3 regulator of GUCY2D n=1 Tax=Scleropages formosus TaxID=113540 RepID=A0A8C9SA84_SCLFO